MLPEVTKETAKVIFDGITEQDINKIFEAIKQEQPLIASMLTHLYGEDTSQMFGALLIYELLREQMSIYENY